MKTKGKKVIELWKGDCQECQMVSPLIKELNKEGYQFQQHNIADKKGNKLWGDFEKEIDAYSRKHSWEEGYIYTPTFIRPDTRVVMAVESKIPTKDDLIKFAS